MLTFRAKKPEFSSGLRSLIGIFLRRSERCYSFDRRIISIPKRHLLAVYLTLYGHLSNLSKKFTSIDVFYRCINPYLDYT